MITKLAIASAAILLGGCADKVFVGTYSRIGIDVSSNGYGGGVGFKNVAITIAPTKADGEAYDVLGTSDTDMSYDKLALMEVVATGAAAECASNTNASKAALIQTVTTNKNTAGPLIFAADSSFSLLELSWGDASGTGISFGYKRTVGVSMPIQQEKIGTAFGSVSINTTETAHANGAPPTTTKGIRTVFTFATGVTAIHMAQKSAGLLQGAPNNNGINGCKEE